MIEGLSESYQLTYALQKYDILSYRRNQYHRNIDYSSGDIRSLVIFADIDEDGFLRWQIQGFLRDGRETICSLVDGDFWEVVCIHRAAEQCSMDDAVESSMRDLALAGEDLEYYGEM